jgi:hypothetical protein
MFSLVFVLIAAFVFWLLLAGFPQFIWGRRLPPAAPEAAMGLSPSHTSPARLAYAAATSEMNRLAEPAN